jgi:hypothetical protein
MSRLRSIEIGDVFVARYFQGPIRRAVAVSMSVGYAVAKLNRVSTSG